MCIICVSKSGIKQPSVDVLRAMFEANPDGAGYMYARDGKVYIHKGFMNINDFLRSVRSEKFTKADAVVYHFRISTQAGVNPEMTHPFPLVKDLRMMTALDVSCNVGVAHNGIIRMTTNGNKNYSDTALFVAQYLPHLIRKPADVESPEIMELIEQAINSKMALLRADGFINTVGYFIEDGGLLFSNASYKPKKVTFSGVNLDDGYRFNGKYYSKIYR